MEYKYKAFISYRREGRDSVAAQMIQQMLEQYVIPKDHRKDDQKKLGHIFRDKTHIDANRDLSHIIYDALDSSEYLIVICSRKVMDQAHPWVMDEISYFLAKHPDSWNNIVTVLVEDDPSEAIPDILYTTKKELDGSSSLELPNYVDIRGKSLMEMKKELRKRFFQIAGTLLSCSPDALAMRDKIQRRTKTAFWIGGIAAVLAVITGILMWSNWRIDGKNEELQKINQELQQQINERLLRESELLTQSSVEALAAGDQHTAIRDAVNALPDRDDPRPYYAPAEQALYAALDIFSLNAYDIVLRDTVFEQTSAVVDICFSSDGTKLFTTGTSGIVSCFDIVSGGLLWTQTSMQNYGSNLCLCESQGSILVYGSSIFSLSVQTGEVLWVIEDVGFRAKFALSDDETTLVCMSSENEMVLLTCISPVDGTILRTIPVARNYANLLGVPTNICDFSSDGHYFTGCFMSPGSGGYDYSTVFLADMETGEVRLLPPLQDSGCLRPCSVEFTDNDSTVTVIHYEYNSNFFYRVGKIRVSDGKLLWQTYTPEQDFDYYVFRWGYADWIHEQDYLLLGIQHQLYVLDMATGALFETEHLPSRLQRLQKLDQDSFALVLEDGTYRTGEISGGNLRLHENISSAYDQSSVMNLGPNLNACLGNRGYLRVGDADGQAISVISSDHHGSCYVAFVPQENDWQIIVRQAIPFDPPLEKKRLYAYDQSGTSYFRLGFCGSDTFYLEELCYEGKTLFFDRRTLEQVYPESGIIRCNEDIFIGAADFGEECNILLADDSILTAVVTEYGLKLQLNGEPLPDAVYPESVDADSFGRSFSFGRNGYVLLEMGVDPYNLYDIRTQQWYTIPAQEEGSGRNITCLGVTKPTFTELDRTGILRIYDIPTGKEIQHIDTGLNHNDFDEIQWIMDDRYLLAQADLFQYYFLDGVTGEVLFRYTAKTDNLVYMPKYISDPRRNHFFIWDDIGVCIDTESWAVLTEIPGMELYDPVSGMIFFQDPTTTTDYFEQYICAISLPTTEELVAIGKAYLGQ